MHGPGINGEGELRGNWLTQVHLEKWPLKWSVCVSVGNACQVFSGLQISFFISIIVEFTQLQHSVAVRKCICRKHGLKYAFFLFHFNILSY